MENAEVIEQNDSWSNDLNDSDLHGIRKEVSSASIYGNGLESPILGSSFRVPDIPKRYIEPIALDTSLPYVSMSLSITWYSMVFVLEAGIFKSEYRKRLFYLYCYLNPEHVIDRFIVEYFYDKFMTNFQIPVYMHLKTYDLKPIERLSTPPILTELRLKCQ